MCFYSEGGKGGKGWTLTLKRSQSTGDHIPIQYALESMTAIPIQKETSIKIHSAALPNFQYNIEWRSIHCRRLLREPATPWMRQLPSLSIQFNFNLEQVDFMIVSRGFSFIIINVICVYFLIDSPYGTKMWMRSTPVGSHSIMAVKFP